MNLRFFLQPFTDIYKKQSSSGNSCPELDGLRGIAVLIVLLSHTSAFGMYAQGSIGVLLFFFLSGYVLSIPFVQDPSRMRSKRVLWGYFINRILRIVPIYWVALLAIYWLVGTDFSWVLWNASFIKGWNHFWSIAEEARFYLLFPIVIWCLSYLKNKLLQIILLVIAIYFAHKYQYIHRIDMLDGRMVQFYFWVFLGGALVCFLVQQQHIAMILKNRVVQFILMSLAILVLMFIVLSSTHYIDTLWRPIIPSIPDGFRLNGWAKPLLWFWLFFVLFIAATTVRNTALNWFLCLPILRHLGLLSYSMYIFHMNIMFVLQRKGYANEELFFMVLLCSYCVAYCSYILIEKPFLSLKTRVIK